jgi:hypothetical protein
MRFLKTRGIDWWAGRAALTALLLAGSGAMLGAADDELGPQPTWKSPTAAVVREQVLAWLKSQAADERVRGEVEALWPAGDDAVHGSELLDRLVQSIAIASPQARPLVEHCAQAKSPLIQPDFAWLREEATAPLARFNLRLYYGRWLAQRNLFDEAILQLGDLKVEDVVDPASLLFYQAVSHHRLVSAEPGQKAARRLLERPAELPQRYRQLAQLMADDLKQLKEDSLDHIARRMDDIRRRLDRGRAGKKVREVEDGVIASLDKLIKELEDQQKQSSAAAAGAQGAQSTQPAPDSRILTQKGPGNVDRKNVGQTPGWGSLPPKERDEALQQIGKEFPAHFRDAIEQYFRKIAASEEEPE